MSLRLVLILAVAAAPLGPFQPAVGSAPEAVACCCCAAGQCGCGCSAPATGEDDAGALRACGCSLDAALPMGRPTPPDRPAAAVDASAVPDPARSCTPVAATAAVFRPPDALLPLSTIVLLT